MIHFISDLHLSAQTPGVTRRFIQYLDNEARQASQLFILGDLFEAWPGDDCIDDPDDTFNHDIVEALCRLHDTGVSISVQHGNRDFLLDSNFAGRTGAQLLPDPCELSLAGRNFVLSHGDALCIDDVEYQAFRAKVRHPAFRAAALSRPLAERKAMAASFRTQSELAKEAKNREGRYFSDLDAGAIEQFLRASQASTFIHGHTHLPDQHSHLIDGRQVERWVLADWHEDRGEYLCFDGQHLVRHSL